jgi:DNA-binding MarR family transcriptional regulator
LTAGSIELDGTEKTRNPEDLRQRFTTMLAKSRDKIAAGTAHNLKRQPRFDVERRGESSAEMEATTVRTIMIHMEPIQPRYVEKARLR